MNARNKILTQILIVSEEYDLEIININFRNITSKMDRLEFTFKYDHDKFIIKFSYEKDNMYDVITAGRYVNYKLRELLMGE